MPVIFNTNYWLNTAMTYATFLTYGNPLTLLNLFSYMFTMGSKAGSIYSYSIAVASCSIKQSQSTRNRKHRRAAAKPAACARNP